MSLSTRILLGLVLGVAAGLFFGEYVAFLGVVGDGFVMLLQMTVLPYVTVSLAYGLGSVSGGEASNLARRAGGFLVLLWALSLFAVFLSPLALPDWESASFFSSNLLEERGGFDFLGLFIPSNIFRSLADAVVPAIVLFSLAVGAALIGIPQEQKRGLLQGLATLSEVFSRITGFVVRLAPYGVFAITAHAGGTLSLEEAEGLQVFAALYIALALVLTFWTLPVLVTTLTPFSYREVVWSTRDALVTSFATGNMFVVLAMLAERSKALLRNRTEGDQSHDALVDVVVPTSFTFPSAGKLLTLSYLFFAGWLSGYAISVSQYPAFLATGMAAFFGNTMVAVPFLLDLFRIPADMFPLFVIVDNIVGNRFGAVLAAMHTLVLVLLSASAIGGMLRVRTIPLLRYLAITLLLTLAAVGGVRLLFETFSRPYQGYAQLIGMLPLYPTAKVAVLEAPPDPLPSDARVDAPTLDRILERGVLRVGYAADALPFAFHNREGELVGFDVEMAHTLALELGVDLELVRIEGADLARLLDAGYLDTAMTGVQLTTERMAEMSFSTPYLEEALGFLVPDHRREEFSSRKSLQRMESPRIGILDVPYHIAMLRLYLPQAEIVVLQSPREFLRGEKEPIDAMLFPAESAGAWSLVYPSFTVAIPQPDVVSAPLAYPVARDDLQMAGFLSNWVELKKKDGTIESLHEHWILGGAARQRGPRWSVIRDVLGWVE